MSRKFQLSFKLSEPAASRTTTGLIRALVNMGLAFSICVVLAVFCTAPFEHSRKIMALSFMLSTVFPRASICILLACLPLFGNKPGTVQLLYLTVITASSLCGLAVSRLGYNFTKGRNEIVSDGANAPLIFYSGYYLLASILSLSSLPLDKLLNETIATFPSLSLKVFSYNVLYFIQLGEDKVAYSVLSVCLSVLAFSWAYQAYVFGAHNLRFAKTCWISIVLSLLLAVVGGLLDYYNLIDLRAIRELDPVVNPGNIQFRLQSFFGHSGWLAEYITLSAPFTVVVLALAISFRLRLAIILVILLLGEFTLILTYQRGGWVSYPLTLFVIWAAIYVTRKFETGNTTISKAFRASVLKVFITLPLTVLFSLTLIYVFVASGMFQSDTKANVSSYVGRFQDIQKTADRTEFMVAGTLIGALHPFLGGGSESFFLRYEQEVMNPTGHLFGKFFQPLHGTAHNVFAQTFSGKGIVGISLLLLILYHLVVTTSGVVFSRDDFSLTKRIVLISALPFGIAFSVYGMVQEVFYVQSLQMLFFLVVAVVAATLGDSIQTSTTTKRLILPLIFAAFLLHLAWEYGYPGFARRQLPDQHYFGYYQLENDGEYQWCNPHARFPFVIIRKPGRRYVQLNVRTDFFEVGLSEATFKVFTKNKELFQTTVKPNSQYSWQIDIPKESREGGSRVIDLDLELDSHFIPRDVFKSGRDFRVLGFRLLH